MGDSSDGQDLVVENSLGMVLEEEEVTIINQNCLEAPSIILTDGTTTEGLNVSHYIIPHDVSVGGFEEVVEEVELGSSWDSITSGSSVTSFGQDSGIESDANPDVFFAFVDDTVSPMTLLTSVPSSEDAEVFVQKMHDLKEDILLYQEDDEMPSLSAVEKDLFINRLKASPQIVKLVIKEEDTDIMECEDSIITFDEDEFLQDFPSKKMCIEDSSDSLSTSIVTTTVSSIPKKVKLESSIAKPSYEQLVYHCTECNKNFASHKMFKNHMEDHLVRLQNSCALCNQEFNTKSELQDHIKDHFAKSASVTCETCLKEFVSKAVLKRHKKQMHSNLNGIIPTQSLKCDVCSSVFSSKFSLKSHAATHSTRKPFTCKECGATFTQNGSLQVHLRRHRGEKPFKCNICGNNFTRAHSLKVHMKTHTGEKPYSCEYCGACFVTSSHLTVHRRTHTGERPYSCGSCGATFITTSHLNVHRRLHNSANGGSRTSVTLPNPKTISCSICEASFDDPGKLRHHRRTDHKGLQRSNGTTAVKMKTKDKRIITVSTIKKPLSSNTSIGCG